MCGVGGVTGRPRDPAGGASSHRVQKTGQRPRVLLPVAQSSLLAREAAAAASGPAARTPSAAGQARGREDAGSAPESPGGRTRSGRRGGRAAERWCGVLVAAGWRTGWHADPPEQRPAPGRARETDGSVSRWPLSKWASQDSVRSVRQSRSPGAIAAGGLGQRQKLVVPVEIWFSTVFPSFSCSLPGGVIFHSF